MGGPSDEGERAMTSQWMHRDLTTATVPTERPMYSHPCDHPAITHDDVLDAADALGDWTYRPCLCGCGSGSWGHRP